jgi:DnaK suppressor protein
MTQLELDRHRTSLELKLKELQRGLRRRDGIEIVAEADQFDEAQRTAERDLLITNLDRDSIMLRDVRAALARLEDGTFGACLRCEEDIAPRRLAAVPWASLCLKCQEWADAHRHERHETADDCFAAA